MQFSDNATLRAIFGKADSGAAPGTKFKSNKFMGIINTCAPHRPPRAAPKRSAPRPGRPAALLVARHL